MSESPELRDCNVKSVYVRGHKGTSGGETILHTSKSCISVKKMEKVIKKDASVYPPNQTVCKRCVNNVDYPKKTKKSLRRLMKDREP